MAVKPSPQRIALHGQVTTLPENLPLLSGTDLHLSYGHTPAVRGVDIDLHAGEIVAITGHSGSGKSSLLYALAGIVAPSRGTVTFEGTNVTGADETELSRLRRTSFGFVFQFGELVSELTVRENVELPLRLMRVGARQRRDRAQHLLEALGIAAEADRRPAHVSGGQAQRAAVARALVHEPKILFADEPTGSLDRANSALVLQEMVRLARETGTAVALVTHEPAVAAVADRVVHLTDGKVA